MYWRFSLAGSMLLLTLALMLCGGADALVGEEEFEGSRILWQLDRFGFEEDGHFVVKVTPSKRELPLILLVCNNEDWWDAFDSYENEEGKELCDRIYKGETECELIYNFRGVLDLSYTIKEYDMYHFDIVNCYNVPVELDVEYTFMNPDDEHLGWPHIPLPLGYSIGIGFWIVGILIWWVIMHRHKQHITRLHVVIMVTLVVKVALFIFNAAYWEVESNNGDNSFGYTLLLSIVNALYYAYFFAVLLLVTMGWGWLRKTMWWQEIIISLVLLFCLYFAALWIWIFGDYYILPIMLPYLAIFAFAIWCTQRSIALYRAKHLRGATETELRQKTVFFIKVSTLVLAYIMALLILVAAHVLFFTFYTYVFVLFLELADMAIIIGICAMLGPQRRKRPIAASSPQAQAAAVNHYRASFPNEPEGAARPVDGSGENEIAMQEIPLDRDDDEEETTATATATTRRGEESSSEEDVTETTEVTNATTAADDTERGQTTDLATSSDEDTDHFSSDEDR
ncbi:hypothetical protein QOT17_006232 [Balamuthia mandrillaris]